MSNPNPARPPKPYEKFVETMKIIVSVPKKEVEKAMREFRRSRKRRKR